MKAIAGIIVVALMVISVIPFLDIAVRIQWTTYLGIPLIILTGSAGVAFVTKRFEAIIGGALLSVVWPAVYAIVLSYL